MIQDPEKEPERWDEPIVADNPRQAKQECQKRADRYQVEFRICDSTPKSRKSPSNVPL